ncbi:MAG: transporter substrate-binding domain-containing protein [Gammaproteobacteria bacterium]|nr:transporter substrate-binding domain-containing protein [Gammaproteobacteria bacterium]
MNRSKLFRGTFLLVIVCLCSPSGADVLDDILDRGTIRVAVAEFVPWTLKDKNGELIGFEIDMARKIAADMGVEAEFEVYVWEDIIPALEKGEIDIIAGGMAITPARALRVNFSRPLATSGVGLATNTRMTRDITKLEQLDNPDIVITTVKDTFAYSVAELLFAKANLRVYSTRDLAEQEIIEGRAHAYLASMAEVRFLVLKNEAVVDLPISEPLVANKEAIAVRKGEQQLLNFLDAWVTARQADKWLPTTRDYWFGTLDWLSRTSD